MNCIKCGAPLAKGQTICSNCGALNSNNDYFSQYSNQNIYQNNQYDQYNQNDINNVSQENSVEQEKVRRQNIFLRVASVFALISGVATLFMSISNTFITAGLNRFNVTNLVAILISILFVFYAFLLSNFNVGKNKLFDNKVLFVIFLIINVIVAFAYNIYFLVLIFGVTGFIISLKKEGK